MHCGTLQETAPGVVCARLLCRLVAAHDMPGVVTLGDHGRTRVTCRGSICASGLPSPCPRMWRRVACPASSCLGISRKLSRQFARATPFYSPAPTIPPSPAKLPGTSTRTASWWTRRWKWPTGWLRNGNRGRIPLPIDGSLPAMRRHFAAAGGWPFRSTSKKWRQSPRRACHEQFPCLIRARIGGWFSASSRRARIPGYRRYWTRRCSCAFPREVA